MSLNRFIYYSAVIAGWAAFLAWLVLELLFLHSRRLAGTTEAALTGLFLGLAIGAGLNFVSAMASGRSSPRFSLPLVVAALVAASGGTLGAVLYSDSVGFPRCFGLLIMGLGIGASEGICESSAIKVRNGLIGGGIGGFLAGLVFDPIAASGSGMSSRAAAFVILGVAIGALIGLTQVVLKRAWITVVDGYGPGRQLILGESVTILGRGDHLPLPFIGYAGRDLESEHLRISRREDGRYVVEDNNTRTGTSLNGQPLQAATVLSDGDRVKLGSNIVRFNHRQRMSGRERSGGSPAPPGGIATPPPPPSAPAFLPPSRPASQPTPPSSGGPPALPVQEPAHGSGPKIPPPPPPPGS